MIQSLALSARCRARANFKVDARVRVRSRSVLHSLCVLLGVALFGGCDSPSINAVDSIPTLPQPQHLQVVIAPADHGMWLSWIPVRGNPEFTVQWRTSADTIWNERAIGTADHAFVPDLEFGKSHTFVVTGAVGSTVVVADTVVATPRDRPNCSFVDYLPWQSFFCSQKAADAWMQTRGIRGTDLKCRGLPVTDWGPDAPDCVYSAGDNFRFLMLRGADNVFNPSTHPPTVEETRTAFRYAIWRDHDPFTSPTRTLPTEEPFARVGTVSKFQSAKSFVLEVTGRFKSRFTRFTPVNAVPGHYAIYHEGHGLSGTEIGTDMIDFLLERGWEVYAMDMPMYGMNKVDQIPGQDTTHFDLWKYENASTSVLSIFMTPVKQMVDFIEATRPKASTLLMMGRSGGGWSTYLYSALDPRITAAVSVAGGRPMSQRLDAPWGPLELGDTEQYAPEVFGGLRYEDLMVAGGSRGALLMFNTWDPCCYRVSNGDPFLDYLAAGGTRTGRIVRGFADPNNITHGLGPAGFAELDRFLVDVTR